MQTTPIIRWLCWLPITAVFMLGVPTDGMSTPNFNNWPADDISIQVQIRDRLKKRPTAPPFTCQGELICGVEALPQAYGDNDHRPLWVNGSRKLTRARALADAIACAGDDGLPPADYHLDTIRQLLARIESRRDGNDPPPAGLLADLDLILTDAFLLLGSHLAAGRVNPETLHADWKIDPAQVDLLAALHRAATTGDMDAALDGLRPVHSGYASLQASLAKLRRLADNGGWPTVETGHSLRPGSRGPTISDLRRRLVAGSDLAATDAKADMDLFDPALEKAVKRFQQRHGLKTDGIVGPKTTAMLNVPADQRIQQVVLNLERWRWLPDELGPRHIRVNTADFNLSAVENGREALRMRVVVGQPARRSPVFSARMTYLVVNPYWNVPTSIAVKDILPELRKDVSYLAQRGIRVFRNWDRDAPEVDPSTVDWQAYHANRFPFRLRQDPGPRNALGRIKFMFFNPFAAYLHDTPNRSTFNRTQRDFSSGCIRLEKPVQLAAFVLHGQKGWTPERIADVMEMAQPRTILLDRPIPVHLMYMTAWTNAAATLQFRRDIYGRDRELADALNQRRPNAPPDFFGPSGRQHGRRK